MNKYNAKKLTINGETFDSKREYNRWLELNLLLKAGRINNLKRQEVYELLPNQYNCGQLIERSVKYKADFVYEENNKVIVETVKAQGRRNTSLNVN